MKKYILFFTVILIFLMIMFLTCAQPGGSSGGSSGGSGGSNDSSIPASPWWVNSGNNIGQPSSSLIGPAGGTLSSPDNRFKVTIPAGALTADTQISIQPKVNDDYEDGSIGIIYSLLPDGQTFLIPVQITYSYSDDELDGSSPDGLGIIFKTSNNEWEGVDNPVIDTVAKTVTINSNHFTDLKTIPNHGFVLKPKQGKGVRVGQKANLQIAYSLKGPIPAANIVSWSVNEIVGGNSTIGTVIPTSVVVLQTAEYSAPATKPTPNFATVEVQMQIGTESFFLWTAIWVFDAPAYYGTVQFWGAKVIGVPEIAEEIQWHGSSILFFNKDPDINGLYNIDTVNSKVRFHEYTIYHRHAGTSNYLIDSTSQISYIGGAFLIIQNDKYGFGSKALVNGRMQSHNGNIYILSLGTDLTSFIHANDPYRNLGDGKNLKGESTYSEIITDQQYSVLSKWNFTKVD